MTAAFVVNFSLQFVCLQAWSITYVSWLTFVFLIWSCLLWMVRDRRRYAMLSSPFMVAYGNLLIVLQYIWTFPDMDYSKVKGFFVEKKNPFHSLSSKVWEFTLAKQLNLTFSLTACNLDHLTWFNMCRDLTCTLHMLHQALFFKILKQSR